MVRAIDIVNMALDAYGAPIYIKHQIVHNQTVVEDLLQRGVKIVEDAADIPPRSNVVFSAHGSAPRDYAVARELNLNVIDATCPLVTRVHNEAKKYKKMGKKIILIGHSGHQEVIGTSGYADMHLIDERREWNFPDWNEDEEIVVLTQTTLSVNDTAKLVEKLKEKYRNLIVRNDICYATTNRQEAILKAIPHISLMLVIGSPESSNCTRLKEIAETHGVEARLIRNASELDSDWLTGRDAVGVTSGASTPESDVQAVVKKINPAELIDCGDGPENVIFKLPKIGGVAA